MRSLLLVESFDLRPSNQYIWSEEFELVCTSFCVYHRAAGCISRATSLHWNRWPVHFNLPTIVKPGGGGCGTTNNPQYPPCTFPSIITESESVGSRAILPESNWILKLRAPNDIPTANPILLRALLSYSPSGFSLFLSMTEFSCQCREYVLITFLKWPYLSLSLALMYFETLPSVGLYDFRALRNFCFYFTVIMKRVIGKVFTICHSLRSVVRIPRTSNYVIRWQEEEYVFQDLAPCSFVDASRLFGGTCRDFLQNKRNSEGFPDYTASCPIAWESGLSQTQI
jgi:hypothetical protein